MTHRAAHRVRGATRQAGEMGGQPARSKHAPSPSLIAAELGAKDEQQAKASKGSDRQSAAAGRKTRGWSGLDVSWGGAGAS